MLDFFNAYKLILSDTGILLRWRLQNLELSTSVLDDRDCPQRLIIITILQCPERVLASRNGLKIELHHLCLSKTQILSFNL
jgi:hypothetical protein